MHRTGLEQLRSLGTLETSAGAAAILGAAMLVVGGLAGCGASTTAARDALAPEGQRQTDESAPAAAREWVWVSAPLWSPQVFTFPTRDAATDYCITTGSIRACSKNGEWRDVALGGHGQDLVLPAGRAGDDWIFEHKTGGVFVSRGFTGALRELAVPAATTSLGGPLDPPARVTHDGRLLRWSGSDFLQVPIPGRAYDAAFSAHGESIILAEPGVVYVSDTGDHWTPAQHIGVAPRTVAALDTDMLSTGLAAVVREAVPAAERVLPQDENVDRSWLRWLLRRYAGRDRISLPDLVPAVWNSALHLGVVVSVDDAPHGELIPLTSGWLGHGHAGDRDAAFHVAANLQVHRLAVGSDTTLLASHDGEAVLGFGADCNDEEPETPADANACLSDTSGSRSLRVPPGILCAEIVALGDEQLLVGGDDCPADVCAGHPLVRFELSQRHGPLRSVPVPIEGDTPVFGAASDPRDCFEMIGDGSSASIPDGRHVRLPVVTPAGPRLLVGSVGGALRSLPLPTAPDESQMAFADADHGIIVEGPRVWTTMDGGFTWESPTPAVPPDPEVDTRVVRPLCSPSACRVGDYYWMPADQAERAGFEPRQPSGATLRVRRPEPSSPRTVSPWRQAPLTRPSLTPTPTLLALRPARHASWRGTVSRVVGGVVETAPRDSPHAGAIQWYGVTPQAVHFRVATTAGSSSAPLDFGDHEAVAMTERFAVVLRANAYASGASALVVVRDDGHVTLHAVPFARYQLAGRERRSIWPLPLPDGGLGLFLFADGTRWVLRYSRDGTLVAQRIIVGPLELRDEVLAWVEGELGLAVTEDDGVARLYGVSGSDQDITAPRTPGGPCAGPEDSTARRFAGSWGDMRLGQGTGAAVARSWSLSEERDGNACLRATVPEWGTNPNAPQGQGSQLVVATDTGFRGWFISHDATVEWTARFPGSHGLGAEESWQNTLYSQAASIELAATPTGLQMWIPGESPVANLHFPAGLYAYPWSDVRPEGFWRHAAASMVVPDLHLRPGVLTSSTVAHPFSGPDTVQQPAQRPSGGSIYLDVVANARGITRAIRNDAGAHVEWWGSRGELHRATLPAPESGHAWLEARLTPDGEHLFVLALRHPRAPNSVSMAELSLHSLGLDGELRSGPAFEIPQDELGRVNALHTASVRGRVVVGLSGGRSEPIQIWSAGRTGQLRRLGHPIATSHCGANVLTLSVNPPLVVWTDCAVGTRDRFLRVARLAGNQWREVLPARALGASGESVAAVVDASRGLHVVVVEDYEAALLTPARTSWEVVGRIRKSAMAN